MITTGHMISHFRFQGLSGVEIQDGGRGEESCTTFF